MGHIGTVACALPSVVLLPSPGFCRTEDWDADPILLLERRVSQPPSLAPHRRRRRRRTGVGPGIHPGPLTSQSAHHAPVCFQSALAAARSCRCPAGRAGSPAGHAGLGLAEAASRCHLPVCTSVSGAQGSPPASGLSCSSAGQRALPSCWSPGGTPSPYGEGSSRSSPWSQEGESCSG